MVGPQPLPAARGSNLRTNAVRSSASKASSRRRTASSTPTTHREATSSGSSPSAGTAAPGCNANSVAEWMVGALLTMADRQGFTLARKTLGVIGVGSIGRHHARILGQMPESELVGVFDTDHERGASVAAEHGTKAYDSVEGLLADVDAVSVAVPTPAHAAVGTFCFDAGCDVLIEKPIGTTLQEAGVDEADVVKTDGEFIYVLNESELRIIRVSPVEQLELLASFAVST